MGLLEKLQAMQNETPEEGPSIENQLQDINPPSPSDTCSYCEETTTTNEEGLCETCAAKEPCPYCSKRFLHLAKHVCKEKKKAPEPTPEPDPTPQPEPGTKINWEFKKGETALAVLPVKILEQWGTDEDQRYHVAYQPSIGTAQGEQTPVKFDVKDTQLSSMDMKAKKKSAASIAVKTESDTSIGFTLVLDAIPERNNDFDIIEFSEFIKNFCDAVAKENQVDYWSVIDYGKAPGFLASKLERWLAEHLSELNGYIMTASTDTPEFRAVKEVLKRNASSIIQGVR